MLDHAGEPHHGDDVVVGSSSIGPLPSVAWSQPVTATVPVGAGTSRARPTSPARPGSRDRRAVDPDRRHHPVAAPVRRASRSSTYRVESVIQVPGERDRSAERASGERSCPRSSPSRAGPGRGARRRRAASARRVCQASSCQKPSPTATPTQTIIATCPGQYLGRSRVLNTRPAYGWGATIAPVTSLIRHLNCATMSPRGTWAGGSRRPDGLPLPRWSRDPTA